MWLQFDTKNGTQAELLVYVEVCGHEIVTGPTTDTLSFHFNHHSFSPPETVNNKFQRIPSSVYDLFGISGSNNCPVYKYVILNEYGYSYSGGNMVLENPL